MKIPGASAMVLGAVVGGGRRFEREVGMGRYPEGERRGAERGGGGALEWQQKRRS